MYRKVSILIEASKRSSEMQDKYQDKLLQSMYQKN